MSFKLTKSLSKLSVALLIPVTVAVANSLPATAATDLLKESSTNDIQTVYLVRHGEKQKGKNPELTSCGKQRAAFIAKLLTNENISVIYSTNTHRTRQTAQPLANKNELEIRYYSHKKLDELATSIMAEGENTLVSGHSNTTPILAGLFVDKAYEALDESEYDWLYKITLSSANKPSFDSSTASSTYPTIPKPEVKVEKLKQHFICQHTD